MDWRFGKEGYFGQKHVTKTYQSQTVDINHNPDEALNEDVGISDV